MHELRMLLEGRWHGLFGSIEMRGFPACTYDELSEVVEVISDDGGVHFNMTPLLPDREKLIDWLGSTPDDLSITLAAEPAPDAVARAIQLFAPGIPCIGFTELSDITLDLLEFRSGHPAFFGKFSVASLDTGELLLSWEMGIEFVRLQANLETRLGFVTHSSPDGKEAFQLP